MSLGPFDFAQAGKEILGDEKGHQSTIRTTASSPWFSKKQGNVLISALTHLLGGPQIEAGGQGPLLHAICKSHGRFGGANQHCHARHKAWLLIGTTCPSGAGSSAQVSGWVALLCFEHRWASGPAALRLWRPSRDWASRYRHPGHGDSSHSAPPPGVGVTATFRAANGLAAGDPGAWEGSLWLELLIMIHAAAQRYLVRCKLCAAICIYGVRSWAL